MNMMVETTIYGLSDRGSIPLTSINETLELRQLGSGVLEFLEIVIEVEMSRKK